MEQEEKQLLLKDISARLPYNVVVRCTDSNTDYNCFLTTDILHEIQNGYEYYDYKPYLRPLSSMTKEEKREVGKLGVCDDMAFHNDVYDVGISMEEAFTAISWLLQRHFDINYLIEKGLALEAPEGMYNADTEEEEVKAEIPNTVEEALAILDKIVSEEDMEWMKKRGAISVHLTLGMWIRNNWGFWENSDFYKYLHEKTGLTHPDDISNYIIEEFIKWKLGK